MSEARLMREVETNPAVALRKPEREPMEREVIVVVARVEVPEATSNVVVAFVLVEFVKMAVDGVVAPIGVELMVPPLMVRLSAT